MNPNVKSKNGVITYKGLKEIHTKILIAVILNKNLTIFSVSIIFMNDLSL